MPNGAQQDRYAASLVYHGLGFSTPKTAATSPWMVTRVEALEALLQTLENLLGDSTNELVHYMESTSQLVPVAGTSQKATADRCLLEENGEYAEWRSKQ